MHQQIYIYPFPDIDLSYYFDDMRTKITFQGYKEPPPTTEKGKKRKLETADAVAICGVIFVVTLEYGT